MIIIRYVAIYADDRYEFLGWRHSMHQSQVDS